MTEEWPKQSGVSFTAINQVDYKDNLEIPFPKSDEILIAVEMVGICGAESRAIRGGKKGVNATSIHPGIILGHEGVGIIRCVGKEVKHFSPGDRVAILSHVPCHQCKHCLLGLTNRCLYLEHVGLTRDGSATRYVVLPAISPTVKKIPLEMETEIAALIEPLSCVLHGIQKISPDIFSVFKNKIILVLGAGPIGMIWILFSLLLGAKKVFIVDPYKNAKVILAAIPEHFHNRVSFFTDLSSLPKKMNDIAILANSEPLVGTLLVPYLKKESMLVCFSGLNGFSPERLLDETYGFDLTEEEKKYLNPKLFSEVHYREMRFPLLCEDISIQLIGSSGYTESDINTVLFLLEKYPQWQTVFPRIITQTIHLKDAALVYQHFGESFPLSSGIYEPKEMIKTMICPQTSF